MDLCILPTYALWLIRLFEREKTVNICVMGCWIYAFYQHIMLCGWSVFIEKVIYIIMCNAWGM